MKTKVHKLYNFACGPHGVGIDSTSRDRLASSPGPFPCSFSMFGPGGEARDHRLTIY